MTGMGSATSIRHLCNGIESLDSSSEMGPISQGCEITVRVSG
jgi:hypothetical protein